MKLFQFLLGGLILMPLVSIGAAEWSLEPAGCAVQIPEGWFLYDKSETGRLSFTSPDNSVIFQVTVYAGESYDNDLSMMEEHLGDLAPEEQDVSRFFYAGRSVSLADAVFLSSGSAIRGWFLFIEREDFDFYLTAITPEELYEESLPLILSCLDGFSPDDEGRTTSGVISTLISSSGTETEKGSLSFLDRDLDWTWTGGREDASQLLIEREASILSSYRDPALFGEAWKRYYQMIYRDTGRDLEDLSLQIMELLEGRSDTEKAELLLSWLQGFEYGSTELFSDLLAPVSVLKTGTGDCDSLGLVYCHILNRMGIPAILMVSYEYSHAMAAVRLDREGAGFYFEDQKYVVAEMTKKVDLGMISRDMADMDKWILIPLDGPPAGTLSLPE